MKYVVGIDPGTTGAWAIVGLSWESVADLPTQAVANSKRKEVVLNAIALYEKISELKQKAENAYSEVVAYVEHTHAMQDSAMTAFSMGQTRGTILAVLLILRVPIVLVSPQKWKRFYGLIGSDKDASRTLAIQRYPNQLDFLKRKKDHNRAEALLIANYGFKMENDCGK